MRKPFSQQLYNEYDAVAKSKAVLFLIRRYPNSFVTVNSGYGADLTVNDYSDQFDVEVEVKTQWKGELYQFPDLRVPTRKKHLFENGTRLLTLNNELTHCFLTDPEVILSSPIQKVQTRYGLDEFFVIDLNNVTSCHSIT